MAESVPAPALEQATTGAPVEAPGAGQSAHQTLQDRPVKELRLRGISMGEDGLPHRRSERATQQQHPLADVLEWARAQTNPKPIDVESWSKRAASAIAPDSLPKN